MYEDREVKEERDGKREKERERKEEQTSVCFSHTIAHICLHTFLPFTTLSPLPGYYLSRLCGGGNHGA